MFGRRKKENSIVYTEAVCFYAMFCFIIAAGENPPPVFTAGYTGRIRFTVFVAAEIVEDRETSRDLISFFHLEKFSTDSHAVPRYLRNIAEFYSMHLAENGFRRHNHDTHGEN